MSDIAAVVLVIVLLAVILWLDMARPWKRKQ